MAEYGIPYQGSKGPICNELIKVFPKADNFYDLFGGGFSVTHAMLLRRSKDFKHFHFNEIRPGICELIKKAICGEYNYDKFKPKWISREEFFKKKNTDAYIKMCWSFGSNGSNYMFSKEIEPYKKSMHQAIVFNEFDELAKEVLGISAFKEGYSVKQKRLFLRSKIEWYRKNGIPKILHKFLNAQQLQRLEQLQQLQQLQRLERLNFHNTSYEKIEIKPNSIIYCDPPYKGTGGYDNEINFDKFYEWAAHHSQPVFLSEYNIDHPGLYDVFEKNKRALMSRKGCTDLKQEKVFVNKAGRDRLFHG